jgi:hypothetical protein
MGIEKSLGAESLYGPIYRHKKKIKWLQCPNGLIEWKQQSKGSRLWWTLSHWPVRLQLDSNATSMMVPHAPPTVAPMPVLRQDWETVDRLASTRSKPLDLDMCPTPSHPPVGFVAQPTNRSLLDFEVKTKKPSQWFWCPNHQIVAIDFEAQTRKLSITLVLRLNQETVTTGFKVKSEKPSQWF